MKRILSLITIGLLFLSMFSMYAPYLGQAESSEPPVTEWSRTYGGDSDSEVNCVIQASDGGYALAGWTESYGAGGRDAWLVKTNSTGHMQWNKTYGGLESDAAQWVVQTEPDGGYALAGVTYSFGEGLNDFWLVKTNSTGDMQWSKTFGYESWECAYSVVQTEPDGGYAMAGYTYSRGAGSGDFWLVKTNSDGNHLWNKTYGGAGLDSAYSVVQTLDGGYAIGGDEQSFGGGWNDFWLVKTDADGNMEWNQSYGGPNYDIGYSMIQTSDGGYAMAGCNETSVDCARVWLVKTNSTGGMQWNHTYGEANWECAFDVVQTRDGGYALACYTAASYPGPFDLWLVKTDLDGNMEWEYRYGESDNDGGRSVVQTSDGGYALAGYTKSDTGDKDMLLIKLAPLKIPATVDIDPDTLNLKSNGQWITAYITLPEDYLIEDIDVATVKLMHNDDVVEAADWGEVQDGVLMVKFDRATLRDYLGVVDVDDGDKFRDITLTVKGDVAGILFEGCDTITVKSK